MKYLPLCFCWLLSLSTAAQTHQDWITQADSLYRAEAYQASAEAYGQAFALQDGEVGNHYNAACSWALAGDTTLALQQLNRAAELGWSNLNHIKRDKDLRSLHYTQAWPGVLEQVAANKAEREKDYDKPLQAQLEAIYVRDQTLRQLWQEAEDKFGRDTEEIKFFWQIMAEQDSLNELEVLEILDSRGWVGRSLVGRRANSALWLVIQHAPLETQEKYLPMLEESVRAGESKGSHLALLVDRTRMRRGQPQLYGSQITTNPETGQREFHEIEAPERVNQRRAEVGLGPIQDYGARWGIKWTVEQWE